MARVCLWCEANFVPPKGPGRPPGYCSDGCRAKGKKAYRQAWCLDNPRPCSRYGKVRCTSCAGPMYLSHTTSDTPVCLPCRRASATYKPRRPTPLAEAAERNCSVCGQLFSPRAENQTYCSPECRSTSRAERRKTATGRSLVLGGLVSRHGAFALVPQSVACVKTVGVLVECPECAAVMAAPASAVRVCVQCATEVRLNVEELDVAV